MEREIHQIIVHCSDTETGDAAAIRRFHMAPPPSGRGWNDIGYHFVINRSGTVEPGRPERTVGAHCQGHNSDSIGICLIGVAQFTLLQWDALKHLLISLMNKYGLEPEHIHGHYEFDTAIAQGKTCPNITVDEIRKLVTFEDEKNEKV